MAYKEFDFSDPTSIDWDEVAAVSIAMYSDLNQQFGCCKPHSIKQAMYDAAIQISLFPGDKEDYPERYKSDARLAYEILYPIAS